MLQREGSRPKEIAEAAAGATRCGHEHRQKGRMGMRGRIVPGFWSVPSAIQKMRKKDPPKGGGNVPEANVSALRACGGLLLGFQRVLILLFSVAVMFALAAFTAASVEAQQVADNSYNPPIENPAYPQNSGPVVVIDEAHFNFHTMEGRFKPFATLLQRDGFVVRPSTSQFSAESLQGVDILVIANARAESTAAQEPNYRSPVPPAFTDAEVQAVRTWVENGGSLWLIADHYPWPGAADNLASAFGVRMFNGYAMRESSRDPDFYFRRSNSTEVLSDHPTSNGRTATEGVSKEVSFTGSAFEVDADRNAQPLLTLGPNVVSIMATRAWTWDRNTPRIPNEGDFQGAVMRVGEGRVAVFGEAAMFSAQFRSDGSKMGMNAPYAEENYKFVLNVSHWLSGLLDSAPPPADTTEPTITLTTPPEGATYSLNQVVNAAYSCQDEVGGSGLKSCQGTVANGSAIDTASTGTKTFTVTATDNTGNQHSVTHTYSVADDQPPVDSTPPETTIDSGPSNPTNSPSASFAFSSNEQGSTFECSLDGAAFGSCTSSKDYTGLADGSHTFQVRATDAARNADPSPATRTWTVDTTKPTITITTPANGANYSLNQVVKANYSCQDGGSGLNSCQGKVPNGRDIDTGSTNTKTFTVTATDNAGNQHSVTHTYSVTLSDCTIIGTSGNDTLNGTPQADVICALEGNDTINSSGGNDILRGGPNDDTLVDLSGTDQLSGGPGADQLNTKDGVGQDRVDGGDNVDSCTRDTGDKANGCP
jgi:hypothetical protein